MPANHTYQALLRANQTQRRFSDSWVWGLRTRTVQESKLYPVSAYIAGSYLNAFYRWPELLRRVGEAISPEDIGERARQSGIAINTLTTGMLVQFYTGGRQILIDMGLIRPSDAVDDVVYVYDFVERVLAAYHRNNHHALPIDCNMKNQIHSAPETEKLEAEAIGVNPGDRLHTAFSSFLPAASTYGFLASCECRLGFFNHGPYKTADGNQMLVRDLLSLGEGDLPWMDGIAAEIPYANLTAAVIMKETDFYIVDDFGSFEAAPAYDNDNLVAVGLYTSDYLTDGYVPVHMENADDLADHLEELTAKLQKATSETWQMMAGWSRTQMLEAGLLVYSGVGREFAHLAGTYEQDDWWEVDDQARRFYPLLNDEYGNGVIWEMVDQLSLTSQQWSPHHVERFRDGRPEMWTPIPYSVLADEEWTATVGPMSTGGTDLPRKTGLWQTSEGKLGLDELNERCRNFEPPSWANRFYNEDVFVKHHPGDPRIPAA